MTEGSGGSLPMSCSPEESGSYVDFISRLQTAEAQTPQASPPESNLSQSRLHRAPSWAPDDAVSHCHNCHCSFGMFWRKHHCRVCGKIFCDTCTSHRVKLPRELDNFPSSPEGKEWQSYLISWMRKNKTLGSEKERVCDVCKTRVDKLWRFSDSIRIVTRMRLNLQELCVWGSLSTEWYEAVRVVRSMHKDLQFRFPWYRFSNTETDYLLRNMEYFAGHSKWLLLVMKAVDWSNAELSERAHNLCMQKRRHSCHLIQCKASECHATLSLEEAVELLSCNIVNAMVKRWLLTLIDAASESQFECLIPLLIFELRQERYAAWSSKEKDTIFGLLFDRSRHHLSIRSAVYWNLVVMRRRSHVYRRAYEQFMLMLDRECGKRIVWDELIRGRRIVKILEKMPETTSATSEEISQYFRDNFGQLSPTIRSPVLEQDDELVQEFESNLNGSLIRELVEITPTILPCAPERTATAVDIQGLKVKSSATSPVVISFLCEKMEQFDLLYKRECLLKDQIAVNVIRMIDQILKRDLNLDLHIVSYRVLPTDENAGLVEIIPNSETIHSILHHQNFTLQNWILEHARGMTVDRVRDNFVKSTAAYCVISYLLAVGDRHLDNIMVTEDGCLFHIDYSFFMGFDPKPMAPYMRITQDMVDALGGTDSKDYAQFKIYCSQAYNCLRNYTNLFACMLRLITEDGLALDDGCFTRARLEEELLQRFVPGESMVDAELQLLNRLQDSYRSSTPQFCIDFWHYHSRESGLTQALSKVPSWGFVSIWPFSK